MTRRGALGALVGGAAAAVGCGALARLEVAAERGTPRESPPADARAAGLRVIEGLALEAPVLAVLGGGALGLRSGLGAVLRDRLVADARAHPGDWDVFLATRGGSWLLAGRPDR